jgi:mannose PTS system EIIA component
MNDSSGSQAVLPVVLVGHGPLATGLAGAVEMICGPLERVEIVQLLPEDDTERVAQRLEDALQKMGVATDDEALIFVDLFGAAPANAAASLLRHREKLEIVAGMNLPMLVETLMAREGVSARELAEQAVSAGRESVRDVAEVVRSALAASKKGREE